MCPSNKLSFLCKYIKHLKKTFKKQNLKEGSKELYSVVFSIEGYFIVCFKRL